MENISLNTLHINAVKNSFYYDDSIDTSLIFLVDDNPVYLSLIKKEMMGYYKVKVKAFSSGEECLESLHLNPTLIILDYDLNCGDTSILDGIDTLKKIKEKNKNIEVLMLTGKDDAQTVILSIKSGAYDYILKDENALINVKNKLKNIMKKRVIVQRLFYDKQSKIMIFPIMIGLFLTSYLIIWIFNNL